MSGATSVQANITEDVVSKRMPSKRHHRCNLCGKDFETGEALEEHIERRHPKEDLHWWVVAEEPDRTLKFER